VAARPDLLRGQFGHWTTTVRRSGLGVVLGPAGDLDGDLLACPLPRSWPLAPRPGLGWLVQAGRAQLVQVASPEVSGEHITAAGG
jgi:S-DNA-T family DNA segregation ATPase FtsK/SpoIIIE